MSHRESPKKAFSSSKLARRLSFSPKSSKVQSDKDKDEKAKEKQQATSGSRRLPPARKLKSSIGNETTPQKARPSPRNVAEKSSPERKEQKPPSNPGARLSPIVGRPNAAKTTHQGMRGDPKLSWKPIQAFATG